MAMRNALCKARQIEDAEQDEHQADGELHSEADARWNDDVEENDGSADTEDGDGVADAPQHTDRACLTNAALAADDGRNCDDVVGIRGMAHAENKAQTNCCQQIHHAALSQFHRLKRHVWPAYLQQHQTISSYS